MDRIYHWNWPFFSHNLRAWLPAHQEALCLLYDATRSIREEGPVSRRLKSSKYVCVCVWGGRTCSLFTMQSQDTRGIPQLPRGQCPERNQGNVKVLRRNSQFQAWWVLHTSNPSTRRLRQEAHEFEFNNSPAWAEKLSSVKQYTTENGEMGQCEKSLQHICGLWVCICSTHTKSQVWCGP